jgi:hypothetical protein
LGGRLALPFREDRPIRLVAVESQLHGSHGLRDQNFGGLLVLGGTTIMMSSQ